MSTPVLPRFKTSALISASLLTFVMGVAVGNIVVPMLYPTSDIAAQVEGVNAPTAMPRAAMSPEQEAKLISLFNKTDWNAMEQPAGMQEIAAGLAQSKALRAVALARFSQAKSGEHGKFIIGRLLTERAQPDVVAAAHQWAQQADSEQARANGLQMMVWLPRSPEIDRIQHQAFFNEKDPSALALAMWGMRQEGIAKPAEVALFVPRLVGLTTHESAGVRAASIQRLAEWDKAKIHLPAAIMRALSDPSDEVRSSAIGATSIAALSTDAVKERLLSMISNEKETADVRSAAMMNIDRFGLSTKEYEAYMLASAAIEKASEAKAAAATSQANK